MALTANVIPKYKGIVGTHPQLEDSSISDDGEIVTTQGRAVEFSVQTTTPYTFLDTDEVIIVNAAAVSGGASFVVNLPAASGSGRRLSVKSINARVVEVTPDGVDTIDGTNSAALIGRWGNITLLDYAANAWVILY